MALMTHIVSATLMVSVRANARSLQILLLKDLGLLLRTEPGASATLTLMVGRLLRVLLMVLTTRRLLLLSLQLIHVLLLQLLEVLLVLLQQVLLFLMREVLWHLWTLPAHTPAGNVRAMALALLRMLVRESVRVLYILDWLTRGLRSRLLHGEDNWLEQRLASAPVDR